MKTLAKFNKQYVYPFLNDDEKDKIRKWIGKHNGVSIARTDWMYLPQENSMSWTDCYILNIKNEKTELLYVLSFPDSPTLEARGDLHRWEWADGF